MATEPLILAIETSCDETAVALMRGRGRLLASLVASQIELHRKTGGVVPEVASRNHLATLQPLVEKTFAESGVNRNELSAVAATSGPGLASALMVGAGYAKGLAIGLGIPYYAINHLEGHLLSPFFETGVQPSIGLIVSGGHTLLIELSEMEDYRLLGGTVDDAAGEAFDKVAKMLGLPYPGGPEIDRLAAGGDPKRFDLPRSMLRSGNFHFSFSGLKTAVRYLLPKVKASDLADLCASFQAAVVEVLVEKTLAAARATGHKIVTVSGGVSCNRGLRQAFQTACDKAGFELRLAQAGLTTDNAGMIAMAAMEKWFAVSDPTPVTQEIDPNWKIA